MGAAAIRVSRFGCLLECVKVNALLGVLLLPDGFGVVDIHALLEACNGLVAVGLVNLGATDPIKVKAERLRVA